MTKMMLTRACEAAGLAGAGLWVGGWIGGALAVVGGACLAIQLAGWALAAADEAAVRRNERKPLTLCGRSPRGEG